MLITKISVDQLIKDNPNKKYMPADSDFVGVLQKEFYGAMHAMTNAAGGWDHMAHKPIGFEYPTIEDRLDEIEATIGTDLTFLRNTPLTVCVYDPEGEYGVLRTLYGEVPLYKVTPIIVEDR
jgi:hypothetical protein